MNEPLNEMREFMITPTTTTKNENNKQKKKKWNGIGKNHIIYER